MVAAIGMAFGILAGVYCLLVAHRRIGPKPGVNAHYDAYHAQLGFLFKLIGWGSFVVVGLELLSLLFAKS